ncbi:MAG: hypothetical protein IRY87_05655 [Acetobacteraceae bacterium]|nr:hypothetical protein [Acetobacteraceae bacterium]
MINEISVKGLVLHCLADSDMKVRRWAFNSLAQLGGERDIPLMVGPWQGSRDAPEVFEAGLTALACILPRERLTPLLDREGVGLGPATLLALGQQTDAYASELAALRLDPSKADDGELRSAALLIGLRRAPDTLFSGRYPVADVIGDLNTHHDPVVAQYSFWATVEHPDLGLANTRVRPEDFQRLPPNVQGWAYRLLTKSGGEAIRYHDTIVAASESEHAVVREGLAAGLREIFYDGLDTVVLDWLVDERDPFVRDRLLEHMAAHVGKSVGYREEVLTAYRGSAPRSFLRTRLEAANRDSELALELRRIELQTAEPDLFASIAGTVMNNTMNFNAPVNAGGISNSGTGNSGNVQIVVAAAAQEEAVRLLGALLQKIEAGTGSSELAAGRDVVRAAMEKPTKGAVERVVGWLKALSEGGQAAAELGTLGVQAYEKLVDLASNLPSSI